MKIFTTFILSLFISVLHCQEVKFPKGLTDKLPKEAIQKVRKKVNDTSKKLQEKYKDYDPELAKLTIDFNIDTLAISSLVSEAFDVDASTVNVQEVIEEEKKAYDVLLNKYYQALMKKLDVIGKENLKKSQRKWIAFRDEEINFINGLTNITGGTATYSILAGFQTELTKQRAIELYEYLNFILTWQVD